MVFLMYFLKNLLIILSYLISLNIVHSCLLLEKLFLWCFLFVIVLFHSDFIMSLNLEFIYFKNFFDYRMLPMLEIVVFQVIQLFSMLSPNLKLSKIRQISNKPKN